jgi:uncharacterized phage infection (PIP) family protein YhgE
MIWSLRPKPAKITPTPKTSQESLQQILETQEKIKQVKQKLGTAVNDLYRSILSRLAHFWGTTPLWQKVGFGTAIALAITAGFWWSWPLLLVIGSTCAALYVGVGLLLDNHHKATESAVNGVRGTFNDLGEMLGETITTLNRIRQQFSEEVERLRGENDKLAISVEEINGHSKKLSEEVAQLTSTSTDMGATQEKLAQLTMEYEMLNKALQDKVAELARVKSEMRLENQRLRAIGQTLQGTVETLSKTVVGDETQRAAFQSKLDAFLADSVASFDKVADRICEAESKLALVRMELELSNERYGKLLDRYAIQLKRLEKTHTPEDHVDKHNFFSLA